MLAAAELELISAMLNAGDLSFIRKGTFRDEHCLTNEGKAIHHFLSMYPYITDGRGRVPTRNAVLQRFSNLELPPAPQNPDFNSLLHEVHVDATRAQLREYSMEITALAEAVDPLAELYLARQRLDEIMAEVSQEIDYGMDTHADEILERYDAGNILKQGIPWPWPTMNKETRGMQLGDLLIICGRPKTRKTFVALFVAVSAFISVGARVLVFTPEMHPFLILLRSMAFAAALRYSEFKMGELDPTEELNLLKAVEAYGRLDTERFIRVSANDDEASGEDPKDHEERLRARRLFKVIKSTNKPLSFMEMKIEQYKPDLIICDSVYRQAAEGAKKSDSDHKVLTGISRGLKDMASEHEVVVLATHQINREGNKKIGDLSNLSYSDAFSQDADGVFRVITNKREDANDISAIAVLGGRETPFDGVIINNVPCCDFSEIEEITSLKKVMEMLSKEGNEEGDEDEEGGDSPPRVKKTFNNRRKKTSAKAKKAVANLAEKAAAKDGPKFKHIPKTKMVTDSE